MTVNISSAGQFRTLLSSSSIVIADFYADWCGPCKAIAPLYEQLSKKHSKANAVTFTKINVDNQQEIAKQYGVTAMPTFLVFRSGSVINTLKGASPPALTSAVENAVKLGPAAKPAYSTPGRTLGGSTPERGQALNRPIGGLIQSWFDAIVAFFGLYFMSLFSIDPYRSAESSPFNIHRTPPPAVSTAGQKSGVKAAPPAGKRVGTLADISG